MMTGTVSTFCTNDPLEKREIESFHRLLPQLRRDHGGEYVAIRGGRVIASGDDLDTVCQEASRFAPNRPVYCGWIEPCEDGVAFLGRFEVSSFDDSLLMEMA